jgi:hypothetical protein
VVLWCCGAVVLWCCGGVLVDAMWGWWWLWWWWDNLKMMERDYVTSIWRCAVMWWSYWSYLKINLYANINTGEFVFSMLWPSKSFVVMKLLSLTQITIHRNYTWFQGVGNFGKIVVPLSPAPARWATWEFPVPHSNYCTWNIAMIILWNFVLFWGLCFVSTVKEYFEESKVESTYLASQVGQARLTRIHCCPEK